MPLCTTTILPVQSRWGCAFSSVGRPCVAQRVCPMPYVPWSGLWRMTSSRLRSLPSARRSCSPSPSPATAIPAESYPRYSSRRKPSMMIGTTLFLPTYPTMPHIKKTSRDFPRPFLLGQGETELFNYGVGQHFAGDALDLGLRLFARQSSVQRQLKILPLANAFQTFVSHLLERALDGLALGVENAFLQRDVDVGCHKKIIIRDGLRTSDLAPLTQNLEAEVQGPRSAFSLLQLAQFLMQIGKRIFQQLTMPGICARFHLP